MPTLNNIDLNELFTIAMNTKTMRDALGDAWGHVSKTTRIQVTRKGSRTYGSCSGWWMLEARYRAHDMKWERRGTARDSAWSPSTPYKEGRQSVIKMNANLLSGDTSQMIKTLLHETAHLVPVPVSGARVSFHSARFYRVLAKLIQELYPDTNALEVYRGRRWKMYHYDQAMVVVFRGMEIDYLPGSMDLFDITVVPSARILPSGAYLLDLADALDVAAIAEASGWSVKVFSISKTALFTR